MMDSKVLGLLVFLCVIGTQIWVRAKYGPTTAFQFQGVILLAIAVALTFAPRVGVRLGRRSLGFLRGWRRAYALVPMYTIGLAVIGWPNEVACGIGLKGYPCL
jgi:hypothetical protein